MTSPICGIDFGTSNSTIGIYQQQQPQLIALEDGKLDMPSTLFYVENEPRPLFGREAIESYIDGEQGRFMRSMKSVLGSSLSTTQVGGTSVQFERMIAVYLKELKARAEQQSNDESLTHVVMGRPVHFVDDNADKDAQAQISLGKAAKLAGFKEVEFQYEPIAAALAYEATLDKEELALIIDIGGGTADFTLIRLSPRLGMKADRSADILATSGVHIGGTDLDKQLSLNNVMPHFGYKAQNINKPSIELPYVPYFNFASWHLINHLYDKSSQLELKNMRLDIADKHKLDRFIKVVERREAHRVALAVEAAKVGLSQSDKVKVDLAFVESDFGVDVDIAGFNQCIEHLADETAVAMNRCFSQALVDASDVGSVFLTGGSTSVALFRAKLTAQLQHAKIVDGDKFGSVGLGLTLHANKIFA